MYSSISSRGPCPKCHSTDCFVAVDTETMQGLEIKTTRTYCNPCPYQERTVTVNGILVFHDVQDGNTMRVVIPEGKVVHA